MDIFNKPSSINTYLKSGKFKNKHVIITGSTGAIGSEVLSKFLQWGSKVVAFYNKTNPQFQGLSPYFKSNNLPFIQVDYEKITTKITDKFKDAITFLEGILDILVFFTENFLKVISVK